MDKIDINNTKKKKKKKERERERERGTGNGERGVDGESKSIQFDEPAGGGAT